MKFIFLLMLGLGAMLTADAWCQTQLPSGPADTLKRSQDTLEYYQLEQKLQKDRERLKEKKDDSEETSGNHTETEINAEDNQVIRYNDEGQTKGK